MLVHLIQRSYEVHTIIIHTLQLEKESQIQVKFLLTTCSNHISLTLISEATTSMSLAYIHLLTFYYMSINKQCIINILVLNNVIFIRIPASILLFFLT